MEEVRKPTMNVVDALTTLLRYQGADPKLITDDVLIQAFKAFVFAADSIILANKIGR